jgi:twitching motility protein PilT
MTDHPDLRLADFLVAGGHLADDRAAELVVDAARTGTPLASRLVAGQDVSQPVLAQALAAVGGLRYIHPVDLRPSPEARDLFSADEAREVRGLPVEVHGDRVVIAFATPPEEDQLNRAGELAGRWVDPVIAEVDALLDALRVTYDPAAQDPSAAAGDGDAAPPSPVDDGMTSSIDGDAAPRVPVIETADTTDTADATDTAPAPESAPVPVITSVVEPTNVELDQLLGYLLDIGGSDLHLTVGVPPMVRIHGHLRPIEGQPVLDPSSVKALVYGALDEDHIESFERDLELDTAYALPGRSRFRVNVFRQRGHLGAVMRAIPYEIPPFDSLGLPPSVKRLAELHRGLVLVTGPTGSGKSTTLASLLDIVNRTRAVHILSCEDPIEFVHDHKRSIVNQREVGGDTRSFASALKRALREDPDVILVGEMRDLETIATALTAAETGHLVFATLHTQSAPSTVDRIVDVFPPEQQGQVRTMLAFTLQAVITQQLVPTAGGSGRAVAAEVLMATPAIRHLIRDKKVHQIPTQMQAGAEHGMITMDQSLAGLVRSGHISFDVALERAVDPEDLRNLLGRR